MSKSNISMNDLADNLIRVWLIRIFYNPHSVTLGNIPGRDMMLVLQDFARFLWKNLTLQDLARGFFQN